MTLQGTMTASRRTTLGPIVPFRRNVPWPTSRDRARSRRPGTSGSLGAWPSSSARCSSSGSLRGNTMDRQSGRGGDDRRRDRVDLGSAMGVAVRRRHRPSLVLCRRCVLPSSPVHRSLRPGPPLGSAVPDRGVPAAPRVDDAVNATLVEGRPAHRATSTRRELLRSCRGRSPIPPSAFSQVNTRSCSMSMLGARVTVLGFVRERRGFEPHRRRPCRRHRMEPFRVRPVVNAYRLARLNRPDRPPNSLLGCAYPAPDSLERDRPRVGEGPSRRARSRS
jgi:hypothetical protein